jgi:hypothetical protein
VSDPTDGTEAGTAPAAAEANEADEAAERRRRALERLAEIIQGPPPDMSGAGGPVTGGSLAEGIASLGLGLSAEATDEVAGAIRQSPDPEAAAALFQAMLESFQQFKRRPERGEAEDVEG